MKSSHSNPLTLAATVMAVSSLWQVGTTSAAREPRLDNVPGPVAGQEGVPEVATWSTVRYASPLRMLAIIGKRESAGPYLRISRRLRADLEIIYLSHGKDEIYHVNDKWIEPKDNPTREELAEYSEEVVVETLERQAEQASATGAYDVIFLAAGTDNEQIQAAALRCVSAGCLLVVCGNVYPNAESPLGGVWPAKPGSRNSWHPAGATRTDSPTVVGLPLGRLKGGRWMPLAEANEDAVALATGECGAAFLREVGKGCVLSVPTGPISRFHSAIESIGRRYDHDEIWLRFWDQVIYETVRGVAAIPAFADLKPGLEEAPPDSDYVLVGRIVNRSVAESLNVAVHVTNPRGRVVYRTQESVRVAAGSQVPYEVRVPVKQHWAEGLYPVYLTVGDSAAHRQFHQAMEFIPVKGQVSLELSADKRGYLLGEEIRFKLTASSGAK